MNRRDEINDVADRLRDALDAAADVMRTDPAPVSAPARPRPGRAWLMPLAAAAAVVTVVLTSVLVAGNLGRTAGTGGGTTPASGAATARPAFYLVLTSDNSSSNNDDILQVRRTSDGVVTYSEPFPGTGTRGYFTTDASGRFYIATFPACTEAVPVTTFHRIAINDSGRITGYQAVGSPIHGTVRSMAVAPDGSQMAYTMVSEWCLDPRVGPEGALTTAIHVMNLSTGGVRTWQNTVTTPGPDRVLDLTDGLSWASDGRTVVAVAHWGTISNGQPADNNISVLGLNTTGGGGSLQASSRVLLSQDQDCATCVTDAVAGPDGSLTAVERKQGRQLVVRIPPGAGGTQTVLYSATAPPAADAGFTAVFADPSGRWVITWPPSDESKPGWEVLRAGWIRNGALVSLPGTTLEYPDAIAW